MSYDIFHCLKLHPPSIFIGITFSKWYTLLYIIRTKYSNFLLLTVLRISCFVVVHTMQTSSLVILAVQWILSIWVCPYFKCFQSLIQGFSKKLVVVYVFDYLYISSLSSHYIIGKILLYFGTTVYSKDIYVEELSLELVFMDMLLTYIYYLCLFKKGKL